MKRLLSLILFTAILFSFTFAIAENYIPGTWLKRNMVDSFGDPTDDKYIYCVIEGTFERYAKSGSNNLIVTLQVGEDDGGLNFLIKLYKYGSRQFQVVNDDTSKVTPYTIRVKEDDGTITDFSAHMYKTDDCIVFEKDKEVEFIDMIKRNKVVKVLIMDEPIYKNGMLYDYNSYHFNLEYPESFSEAYDWLEVKSAK